MKTARSPRPRSSAALPPSVEPAVVEEVGDRLRVRRSGDGAPREVVEARLARIPGYVPSVGDRVVVSFGAAESYVIAVLHAAAPEAWILPDGARAELDGRRLELRDAGGRLLVRYQAGVAEIAAPEGDLRLCAPQGRVVLEAGLDVSIEGARDVVHRAGRRLDLAAGAAAAGAAPQVRIEPGSASVKATKVDVQARSSRLVTGEATVEATVLARTLATTAEEVAIHVSRYELTATRLVEKTRDAFRDAADLAQSRVGRMRTFVKDVCSVNARRNVMISKEDTTIRRQEDLLG